MGRSLAKLFVLLIVDCTPQRLWRGCLALPLWMNASHLIWCQNLSAAGPGCWLDGRDSDPVDRVWDSFRDHMSYMLLMQKFHGGENHLLLKFPRSPRSQIGRLKVWTWHWDVHCNWGLISQINLVHERGKRKEWKNDPQREGDIWSGIWKIRYFLAKGHEEKDQWEQSANGRKAGTERRGWSYKDLQPLTTVSLLRAVYPGDWLLRCKIWVQPVQSFRGALDRVGVMKGPSREGKYNEDKVSWPETCWHHKISVEKGASYRTELGQWTGLEKKTKPRG